MKITVNEEFYKGPARILGEFSGPHEARCFADAYLLNHAAEFECPDHLKEYDTMDWVPFDIAFREDWMEYSMHVVTIMEDDPRRGSILLAKGNRSGLEWDNPEAPILNEKEPR